jgi:RimJ/RimL family protein N-acetyltransferase
MGRPGTVTGVRLRKLREAEVETLLRHRIDDAGTMGQPGPAPDPQLARPAIRERVAHSGEYFGGEILFAIEADGRLVGEVQARCPENAMPRGVFELGISLFDTTDRGRGIGTEAVAQMTRLLFSDEGAHRVQAGTDLQNEPMRGVLERLGFGFEGVMRGFMLMDDGPHDYALYAMTRPDFEEVRTTWTSTS